MKLVALFILVCACPSVGLAANTSVSESSATLKWQQWMKAYPDSVDFEGGPLQILSEMPLGDQEATDPMRGVFQKIKAEYPASKLIPYVDYSLAVSTTDLVLVSQKYKTEVFPSICSEFLTAWKYLPAPGVKIGALAQMEIADKYFSPYEMTLVGGNAVVALAEWKRVLEFYPDRSSGKAAAINDDEWRRLVLPAMFSWLEISRQMEDNKSLPQIEDEILRLPDLDQGTNYGKRSHAEVYLARATRLAADKKYQDAEVYLRKVAVDYRDVYWGYHGGIGANYYETAMNSAGILPLPQAIEFLKWLLGNESIKKHVGEYRLAWTQLRWAGFLSDLNRAEDAKRLLRETLKAYPKDTQSIINSNDPKLGLEKYFPYEGGTVLSEYYKALVNKK